MNNQQFIRTSKNKPAVFLDRDGTINEEVGYINHPARFHIIPGVAQGIRRLNEAGFLTIVVTNQAGVARGYFEESLIETVHGILYRELDRAGARLDAIYYCPHHPTAGKEPYRATCNCRKPLPGMIEQACSDFPVDLSRSYLIGDRYKDMLFGKKFDLKTIMVLTGYGRGEYENQRQSWQELPDHIARDLPEAVDWLLDQSSGNGVKTDNA